MSPIPTSPTLAAAPAPKAETKRPAPIKLNDATRQKCFEMLAEALEQSESGTHPPTHCIVLLLLLLLLSASLSLPLPTRYDASASS
jgi:hypothetical protein